mgnify:FL=1|tara:strand:- start:649 stop:1266 length:618 start_codon:yes stop_codon:yes gene_type:complete
MLVYLAKYEKAPGIRMLSPSPIPEAFTLHLKKGVGVNTIKLLAAEALLKPDWVDVLFHILTGRTPWDRDGIRKAAWTLHHVYLLDERSLLSHRDAFTDLLDATSDLSVLREIFKILGSPLWSDVETTAQRQELLQLGMDLMYDDSLPLGIHYVAIQLTSFRMAQKEDCVAVQEAMAHLKATVGLESAPLRNCIDRAAMRFQKNWN